MRCQERGEEEAVKERKEKRVGIDGGADSLRACARAKEEEETIGLMNTTPPEEDDSPFDTGQNPATDW